MKICIVTPRYAISGVALAQLRFARVLASYGYEVDLIIGRIDFEYPVPEVKGVNVIKLKSRNVRKMFLPLFKYLFHSHPDVIFSAEDHLNIIVLISAIFSRFKGKISVSSRVTPFDTYSNIPFSKRWILKQFARAVMWRADVLTCVSKDMVKQYQEVFNFSRHICVYNIVDDENSRYRMNEMVTDKCFLDKTDPIIVAAGMLESWKGFGDLILAMNELLKTRKAKLIIFGEGSLHDELQKMIYSLGIEDSVKLFGYVENPLKYFKLADVFVLSSYVEGLPNVLVEAMMCGCTPVATDCPTGPREVLLDNKYGYLVTVQDIMGIAEGIKKAIDFPIAPELLKEAIKPFSEGVVVRRHFHVLGLDNLYNDDRKLR